MKTSQENEIKKIYEKSVRLLNDKQARLMDMQQVLKKSVIRLSLASCSNNQQIKNVLTDINSSVDDHIDIKMLNKHLDQLFVLINHADYRAKGSEKTTLSVCLKEYLNNHETLPLSDEVVSNIKKLVDQKLSDNEISMGLLQLLSNFSNRKNKYDDHLNLFIKDITESTDFSFDKKNIETSEVMQDLAVELSAYIYTISKNSKNDINVDYSKESVNVNNVLTEIVNQLTLPLSFEKNKFDMVQALNNSDGKTWDDIINKLVRLVNESINSIEKEKQSIEAYLIKVNVQLSDIGSFMRAACHGNDDVASLSLALTDSVETGVSSIEKSINASTNLEALKEDVAANLKEIRKYVDDYKQAAKIKKDISLQSYAKMIKEISHSQKESEKLQNQLHESKIQLLRDPLTGIANRLAYDERITVEFNRWKRSNTPLCLALWDIDYFKRINDKYGHGVGDRVLKLFADIIESRIRKIDLFSRIGGEEFVLIMPDTSLEKASMLNNTLRVMLEECNFHYDGKHCQITSSVGIAEFRRGDEPDTVLDKADKALYYSKDNGRNRCTVFDEDL